MTRQRYSKKESRNRILRAFQGDAAPNQEPDTLDGDILSEDQALSDLAEIYVGSLPGETGELPAGISVPNVAIQNSSVTTRGIIETATVTEAEAGTDTARAVTPEGVAAAIDALVGGDVEFGEIYNHSTGTAVVVLSTSWQKITGSFQADTLSSTNIVPDWANDRITINHVGTFFVGLQCSFSGGANAIVEACVYLDGVRQESVRFRRKLGGTGDVGSASAIGIVSVTGTAMDLELWARADAATPNFKLESGQLWTYAFP